MGCGGGHKDGEQEARGGFHDEVFAVATQWGLLGNKERDLIAPRQQAPTSASKKDATSRADWRDSSVFSRALKICGFVSGPVAFVSRKSRCLWKFSSLVEMALRLMSLGNEE